MNDTKYKLAVVYEFNNGSGIENMNIINEYAKLFKQNILITTNKKIEYTNIPEEYTIKHIHFDKTFNKEKKTNI